MPSGAGQGATGYGADADMSNVLTLVSGCAKMMTIRGRISRSSFYFDAQHVYNAILVREQRPITENFVILPRERMRRMLSGAFLFGEIA